MLYLGLTPEESIDLFEILVKSGDQRLATRLKREIVHTLESLDSLERNKKSDLAEVWMNKQLQKIEDLRSKNVSND